VEATLKVVFITRWGVQCGIATYTDQLVQALVEAGHNCSCAAEKLVGIKRIDVESEVPVKRIWDGSKNDFRGVFEFLTKERPAIVHIQHEFGLMNNIKAMLDMLGNIKALKIPVVITCHTVMEPPSDKAWFFMNVLKEVQGVVVHSEGAKKALVKWGNPANKIAIIPHGTPEVKPATVDKHDIRRRLYLPDEEGIVIALSLGFISPGKMQHEAIKAVVFLVREGLIDPRRFLYVIAGEPGQNDAGNIAYCQHLHRMLDEKRAWNYIRIVPRFVPAKQLQDWYGAADFAITGSHQTHHSISGRSHQEMAFGIPSISAAARILSDLTESRSMKYESEVELRSNILAMIRSERLRKIYSGECLDFAKETAWTKVAESHEGFYRSLVGGKVEEQ